MKFNPVAIFTGVVVFFVGVMFASYVWAMYHTAIIVIALCAAAGWVAYSIHKRSKRNDEDRQNGGNGFNIHIHR